MGEVMEGSKDALLDESSLVGSFIGDSSFGDSSFFFESSFFVDSL